MKLTRVIAIGVIAASFGIGSTQAQIREQQPAEFPPASYKGKQYVDSKGCVFVRAGIDGNVSWIPRVTRDRKTICGFQPSLPGAVATAPAPAPAQAEPPVQITVDAPAAETPTPTAPPKPQRVAQKPKPASAAPAPRRAPKPAPVVTAQAPVAAPAPAPRVQASAQAIASACPNASVIAQRYLANGKLAVRCGPQKEPIVAAPVARVQPQAQGQVITAETRIVPKHVAIKRQNTRNVTIPKGYQPAWDDDRLNPHRAEQNLAGRRDMLLVWTNTLPRRLVDRRTGKDMTASIPLIYPYLDLVEQRREIGKVTIVRQGGKTVKRVQRSNKSEVIRVRKPVYSTRSAPKAEAVPAAKPRAVPSAARIVQVGSFADAANARRAAQQIANLGLPARIGKVRSKGRTLMVVQAGPFAGAQDTARALQKVRRAGYGDAFARK